MRSAHWLFVGRTLAWDAEFEKKVMALDAAQIRAALKKSPGAGEIHDREGG